MTYDASSRKDIRRMEKAASQLDATRLEFLRAAMSTTQGRCWFYHFLADLGIFNNQPTFEPNKDYFALGMKNAGMRTFLELKTHCPDLYIRMEQEEYARLASLNTSPQRSGSANPGRNDQGRVDPDSDPDASRDPDLFDDTDGYASGYASH